MNRPDEREIAGIRCGGVLAVLSDFLDGELAQAQREQVVAHLRGCDWCEQFGGRFGEVIAALRNELREPSPLRADVAARLRERLARG